jgi:hypothetical protein
MTISVDNLEVSDDHPDPSPSSVTVTPDTATANTSVSDVLVQTELPLFADPTVEVSAGPDILVNNVRILDANSALVDLTVNGHIENQGHGVKVQTDSFIGSTCIDISGGTEDSNECPPVTFAAPTGLTAGQPFDITIHVEDPDFDYPLIEMVVENPNLGFDEIIFQDTSQFSYEVPATLTFSFEGLPPGNYVALGIAADKVDPFSGNLTEVPFSVMDLDETPADCRPLEPERNAEGQLYVKVELEDRGYGLADVRVVKAENVALEIPEFNPGELAPIYVTATRLDPRQRPYLELEIVDGANNKTPCQVFNFGNGDLGPARSPKAP